MTTSAIRPFHLRAWSAVRRTDLRIVLVGAIIAVLCASFWTGSRYPSLQGKASADPEEALTTPLGFEQHFPQPGSHEPFKRVLWSAAEWAITNKQGMTFGLLLAAGLLTLIPLLPGIRGGRFAGSVQGALIGTPLGVCVNCAAPVGQAMIRAGSRVEVALATMFASPSFNVIVLGILFSLFPFYLVAVKIAASAAMVLLVVPVLARLADRPGWRKPLAEAQPKPLPGSGFFQWFEAAFGKAEKALLKPEDQRPHGPLHALAWVAMRYPWNLWTVLRLALPLMLLAGFIGAAMAELLPWGRLAQMAHVEGWLLNGAVVLVVAAFGVLLPVPIAFDVIVCAVLWDAGVPPHIVATLLVTLGIYSVYPMSLLGTTLSWRIAGAAGVAVFVLGVAAGAAAGVLNDWHQLRMAQQVEGLLEDLPAPAAKEPFLPAGRSAAQLAAATRPLAPYERVITGDGIELWSAAFEPAAGPGTAEQAFTRIDGAQLGFERLPLPRPYMFMEPGVMHVGPLAAGDIDGNGWPDVAVGSHSGFYLYRNLGGRFALQSVDFPAARDWIITALAFVDLDGDGSQDLFVGTWMNGSHILFNRDGEFSQDAHVELPRFGEMAVQAVGFADVDRDGNIDIVTGTTTNVPRFFYPAPAVNHLWRNQGGGQFQPEALAGPQGETLTVLFHDFDGDGWPDLFIGNDFDEPDRIYANREGRLVPLTAAEAPLAQSTHDTMSADTGDLNNDGRPELYIAQIAMGGANAALGERMLQPFQSCEIYADIADRSRCDAIARFQLAVFSGYMRQDMDFCEALVDTVEQRDCLVSAYHWNRILARLPVLGADKGKILAECERIPADFGTMQDICQAIAASPMDHERSAEKFPDELPAVRRQNLLLTPNPPGRFEDITAQWGAELGGWSWNAKFADLDNDGWQDLFIAQGTRLRPNSVSAIFYRNQQGRGLVDEAEAYGLKDHNPTGASLFIDFDLDGDLDLLTYPQMLTPVLWRNDGPAGPGLEVALEDRSGGNRHGIGARVEIQAPDGRIQMRDIKASGGYQSHDLPVARFGLGNWPAVAALRVRWPDGMSQELTGLELGSARYRLIRR